MKEMTNNSKQQAWRAPRKITPIHMPENRDITVASLLISVYEGWNRERCVMKEGPCHGAEPEIGLRMEGETGC